MPNGTDKNLIRLYEVVNGFRDRYGRWPTIVRLGSIEHDNLVLDLLTPRGRELLNRRLRLVVGEDVFAAEDETGARYEYLSELADALDTGVGAEEWLGLAPHVRHGADQW